MNATMPDHKAHEGRNVKRIREILGIKQDTLAIDLGLSQQAVSLLEQREILDPEMLEKVAKVLKVTPEAIKNFNEEATINFISNTFTDNQFAGYTVNNNPTFNPLDKVVELYERMLKEKDAEIESLKKQAGEKKK
jgi:transcriptional regulator with XRE-family HTH domain